VCVVTATDSAAFFDQLRRAPDVEAPELVAVDATDRLLLDEAAGDLAAHPGDVVVLDDSHGALTLGAGELHGATDVRVHQDLLLGELALAENAKRTGRVGTYRSLPLDAELVRGARVVLAKAPKSLDALRELAEVVAAGADPRDERGPRRLLHRRLRDARPAEVPGARGPRPAPGAVVLPALPRAPRPRGHPLRARPANAMDLGCGTGLLAVALATARPALTVLATDQSAAAVASTLATVAANGLAGRVTVTRDDAASAVPDGSVDLVVCNPPFHLGVAVHAAAAERVFAAAGRVLRPGGELWCVYNSHLPHRETLRRLVGPTRQISRDPVFTVTAATRR
jgi:16S rRNA (guanine1207-N2)-methyltransferase